MNSIQLKSVQVNSLNFSEKNSFVDFAGSFSFKGIEYKLGDFVLIKEKDVQVVKLISVFFCDEEECTNRQYRGIVQRFLWSNDINRRIDSSYLKLNDKLEVIETTKVTTKSIALEDIQKKCKLVFTTVDDPIFNSNCTKLIRPIYFCRYKIDCNVIVPIYPDKTFESEVSQSESDYLSSPEHLKRKSDRVLSITDSGESEVDIEKVKSLIIPLKNLKLTPNDKIVRNSIKNNTVKRVLIDSFDGTSKVSYSVVNSRYDNKSIKLTFKLDDYRSNVSVHPTILTDEIVTMRSPIKLRHIQKVNDKILLSENGREELNGDDVDMTDQYCTPTKTPAKIRLRRSTRTTEVKSYKENFLTDSDNSVGKLKSKSSASSTKSTNVGERQRRTIRTPKKYDDSYLPSSNKKVDRPRNISPEVPSAKKSIKFDDCSSSKPTRRSVRTRRPSSRYFDSSYSDCNDFVTTPKKRPNKTNDDVHIISDDEDDFKETTRLSRRASSKTPSKRFKDTINTNELLKTPKTHTIRLNSSTPRTKDTPFARAKLVREGVITPAVQCRQKPILKEDTPLSKARNQLHVSYVPRGLPCREQEYLNIANFLKGKLSDGCGGCMYVSGVPGTGKTATVTEVISSLKELMKRNKIPPFKYVNINGMRLSEPRQAYVEIIKQISGKTLKWEQAQTNLESMFVKSKKKSLPIIMVIDELDILCTKRQDVIYNLLDWPTKGNSQLIVITIANTMDLPERLLMGRVTSRLGLTRLTFQPYTHKQLQEIVTKRLLGTDAFNPDAIQLVARKVASVSGDARRALDICRRAAEIAELEGKYTLVSMNHVNAALTSMITQPKVQAIKHCSKLEKLILQSVVAEVERTGVEETTFKNVFRMLITIAAMEGFQMVSSTMAMTMVARLGASRLLLTDQKCNSIYQRIILNASTDDIHYALLNI